MNFGFKLFSEVVIWSFVTRLDGNRVQEVLNDTLIASILWGQGLLHSILTKSLDSAGVSSGIVQVVAVRRYRAVLMLRMTTLWWSQISSVLGVLRLNEHGFFALLTKSLGHLLVVSSLVLEVLVLEVSLLLQLDFALLCYDHVL